MELVSHQKVENLHFVLCGNKGDETEHYAQIYKGTKIEGYIIFAGYRNDIAELMGSSTIGVIASGWNSFTMSSVEVAACGLPLIVSDKGGLTATVENGVTGFLFNAGDHAALASYILKIANGGKLHATLSKAARSRALGKYDRQEQISKIATFIEESNKRVPPPSK